MRRKILKVLALAPFALLFTSCEKKISHEHREVHWDRDMCERCKMVVSERNHAAQVINKETGEAYMFDDIGCVILWFKEENITWKDTASIWITDVKTSKWIDARTAHYDTVHQTPMAYGFSANEKKESIVKDSEILNFEEMSKRVLQRGR
ncbi:nitrous oxide reductase accessory protein NosL [Arcobacter sp. LA11]|uniref:nitrous oxide reductase accessory protein NosL n=1 Tax=Arcobacter sp. LA11 TaxID=1898176 RepID=UPI00093347EE|nr:nitrous oxide reductase accessory protein NosL [Arcobacter sp. LA11]